jgi:hypothetical protein
VLPLCMAPGQQAVTQQLSTQNQLLLLFLGSTAQMCGQHCRLHVTSGRVINSTEPNR